MHIQCGYSHSSVSKISGCGVTIWSNSLLSPGSMIDYSCRRAASHYGSLRASQPGFTSIVWIRGREMRSASLTLTPHETATLAECALPPGKYSQVLQFQYSFELSAQKRGDSKPPVVFQSILEESVLPITSNGMVSAS